MTNKEEAKAIKLARKFGLEAEVKAEMANGATPEEALAEWDIIPLYN